MDHQSLLLSIESLLDVNPLQNFKILFTNLEASHLDVLSSTARKPFSRQSLLRAIIFKNLKGLPTLTELANELKDNPSAAIRCGFNILKPLPSVERFSSFLKNTPNRKLQKTRILKGSPDARLGTMVIYPTPKTKRISYFWGFRDHVVIDAKEELPIWQITKPAHIHESLMLIPLFQFIQNEFHFNIKAIMGDAIYDANSILKYIVKDLKAKPRISRNPRNTSNFSTLTFSKAGRPICLAQLGMLNRGSFYDKIQKRWRHKWVCPLHHSKKYAKQFIVCPVFHPKFFSQKGCYAYLQKDSNIRSEIDYASPSFKTDAKLRSGSERVFSRLLNVCMQNPPVIGFNAVSNYVTIAHITILLIALTAAKNNMKDKVRFVKSFLPNFTP